MVYFPYPRQSVQPLASCLTRVKVCEGDECTAAAVSVQSTQVFVQTVLFLQLPYKFCQQFLFFLHHAVHTADRMCDKDYQAARLFKPAHWQVLSQSHTHHRIV
jgi:hypothetical protein